MAKCTTTECSDTCPQRPVAEGQPESEPGIPSKDAVHTVVRVPGMDCPTDEALIRKKLSRMPGVQGLDFNLMERRLTIAHLPEAADKAVKALESLGLGAVVDTGETPAEGTEHAPTLSRRTWALLGLAAVTAFSAEIIDLARWGNHWVVIGLSILAISLGGLKTYWKGIIALKNRTLNINALMIIAVTGALAIGEWPEAAMVMVLFAVAEVIESLSLERARHAIRNLMAMAPETATVRQVNGGWVETEARMVGVDSIVRVGPGERVPLDGEVTEGGSAVNQAPITGESMPVEKGPGAQVFAGSINTTNSFEYRVTRSASDSTLSRIIHAVENAQSSKAPTQRFVDRFARVYTPAVLGLAVLVALIPPFALGQPFSDWFYRALVLLMIGCPCALVISTPVTVVSGLASAARRGILIKGGVYLEQGRRLRMVAFDKTGTITRGEPSVTDFLPQPGEDAPQVLGYAAGLAARSDHPLSRAIAGHAEQRSIPPIEPAEFEALPGRGTKGRLNGEWLYLGSHRLTKDLNVCRPELEEVLEELERDGKSVVVLATDARILGVFGVADTARETSRNAIAALHALEVRSVMLSGDNQQTVTAIAERVGIDDARGGLLPEEKLVAIKDLLDQHGHVGMVGDGINDAPALAAASIGFAMGVAGSDTALETADVALMDDDLRKLPAFIRLSRRTASILIQNISLALGIKAVFLGLAVAGEATLWMAVIADMGASLLVVFNGLRLLRTPTSVAIAGNQARRRSRGRGRHEKRPPLRVADA